MLASAAAERAGGVWVVDRARGVAVGGCGVAGVDLAVDQERADQRQSDDPGEAEPGDGEPEAAALAVAVTAGPRLRELAAAGRDQRPRGEEEDRPDAGDFPEPVGPGADRE